MTRLEYNRRYLTREEIEEQRDFNRRRVGKQMKRIQGAATRAREQQREQRQESEMRARMREDPRLVNVGAWDRAVLEAIIALGSMASDVRVLARLRQQGSQSLTIESLAFSLKRLTKRGFIRAESRDLKGESTRFWMSALEEGQ